MDIVSDLSLRGILEKVINPTSSLQEIEDGCKEMNIHCFFGLTKACLVIDGESKWVIKLSLGRYATNYCRVEAKNFRLALHDGLGDFFACMQYVGLVDGIEVYIQERAEVDENLNSDIFREYVREGYDFDDPEAGMDEESYIEDRADELDEDERIYAMCHREYNEDSIEKLIEFIEDHNINDLHEGNWGRLNGRMVLVDYSGYMR